MDRLNRAFAKAMLATIGGDSLTAPLLGKVRDRGSEVFSVHGEYYSL
jgi:hypothetical protein